MFETLNFRKPMQYAIVLPANDGFHYFDLMKFVMHITEYMSHKMAR